MGIEPRKAIILAIAFAVVLPVFAGSVYGQRREHLTDEEIEIVRDVQDVDLRMEVFVKAIERRLWALGGVGSLSEEQSKRLRKDEDKWGALPSGSRAELFSDIEGILEEAINKIEDVYEREPQSKLLPFAFYVLADYSEALIPKLRELAEKTNDNAELGLLERAASHCRDIIEVKDNVPRPTGKRPKPKRRTR